jgi:putative inorganic carbon (hco3(-)) transporter
VTHFPEKILMPTIEFQTKVQTYGASHRYQLPVVTVLLGLLIAFSSFIPFQTLSDTGYHDGQRIATSLYLIVGMLLLGWRIAGKEFFLIPTGRRRTRIAIIFWGLGVMSSMTSYSPRHAFYEWASLAMLFLVSWMIATEVARNSSDLLDRILLFCGVGCSLYIFQALVAYVSALVVGQQPDPRDLIVGFDNYRFLNHIQTISLPLIGILAIRGFKSGAPAYFNPKYWFVTLLLWWMLTFVSGGRGTFLGVWSGMLVVLALHPRQAWPWFRTMSLSCAAGLAAYLFFYWLVPHLYGLQPFGFLLDVAQRTAANPDSSRWPLWQRAIELILSHPWLGVGPLHFAHYSQDLKIAAHPHNAPLQIAAEWGLPALIALSALVVSAARALLSAGRAVLPTDFRNQALFSAFAATGVSIVVDSLVSGLIVMPASQLWIALYLGCAWGWAVSQTRPCMSPKATISSNSRYALMAGVLMLVVLQVKGLWPELLNLPSHETKSKSLGFYTERSHFTPRIWRAGYF